MSLEHCIEWNSVLKNPFGFAHFSGHCENAWNKTMKVLVKGSFNCFHVKKTNHTVAIWDLIHESDGWIKSPMLDLRNDAIQWNAGIDLELLESQINGSSY